MLLKYSLSPAVTAFSTTRVSPFELSPAELEAMGNYAAFNVTDYTGDAPERVERNKDWLCRELGIHRNCLWLPHQTHTTHVDCIDDDFLKLSAEEKKERLENVDALITDLPGQCIGVSTADCVPVLLWDEAHHATAAIHAGWRGTVGRIPQKAVRLMEERFGTCPADLKAVIGPSISVSAFEVGNEVADAFVQEGFPSSIVSHPSATDKAQEQKPHIDLWAANAFLLEEAGLSLENIQISGVCTYQQYDSFFSARRLGIESGRIFTGILWKDTQC